jgi:hypothetical protein
MRHRVFCEWSDGSWVSSLDPDFQASVVEFTENHGPPVRVEFRSDNEGWQNTAAQSRAEPMTPGEQAIWAAALVRAIENGSPTPYRDAGIFIDHARWRAANVGDNPDPYDRMLLAMVGRNGG